MITFDAHEEDNWVLTKEGKQIAENGSHEVAVWKALKDSGSSVNELNVWYQYNSKELLGKDTVKIGQGKAFKNKWIAKNDQGLFIKAVQQVTDDTCIHLNKILNNETVPMDILTDLKKRKLCEKG